MVLFDSEVIIAAGRHNLQTTNTRVRAILVGKVTAQKESKGASSQSQKKKGTREHVLDRK